ncbi:MAG: pilus assembly protein PilM [Planctomycetes bacterium]|nr:pilus assembly protein PilM [Planctomycetota bacterium]
MSRVAGIDIGGSAIKVAVFDRSPKKLRLLSFVSEPLPAPGPEEDAASVVQGKLERIVRDLSLQRESVVASIDAKDATIREVIVPFQKPEQIRKTIRFEAENYLHACAVDDVIVDFLKIEQIDQRSRLILTAARKDRIRERLSLLQAAGIDPVALDLDAAALYNAFRVSPMFDPERVTVLVDIGATSTKILLIERGELKKIRSVRTAGLHAPAPSAAIAAGAKSGLEASLEKAEKRLGEDDAAGRDSDLLIEEATIDEIGASDLPVAIVTDEEFDRISSAGAAAEARAEAPTAAGEEARTGAATLAPATVTTEDLLARIAIEVGRTFASVSAGVPVERLCLCGGLAREPEIRSFFAREFDIEAGTLTFDGAFELGESIDTDALDAEGAVAVGLAMKELGRDELGFDFRREDLRYERRFDRLWFPLAITGLLLFAILFLVTYRNFREYEKARQSYFLVYNNQVELYKAKFEEDPPPNADILDAAKAKRQRLETALGIAPGRTRPGATLNLPEFLPVLDVFMDITDAVKKADVWPRWQGITIYTEKSPNSKISLSLALDDQSQVSKIRTNLLTSSKYFGRPEMSWTADRGSASTGTVQVELRYKPEHQGRRAQNPAGSGGR